jgi:hypothetical protein
MIFDKVQLLFRIRIRIHNLKLRIRIRILQKVSDPYGSGFGSGSTTLLEILLFIKCLLRKDIVQTAGTRNTELQKTNKHKPTLHFNNFGLLYNLQIEL